MPLSIFKKKLNKKIKPAKEKATKIEVVGGEVLPLLEAMEPMVHAPCPMSMLFTRPCVCMGCFYINSCPMEQVCRHQGCERGFVSACSNYRNEEDPYVKEKRTIFKPGQTYDGGIIYFNIKRNKKASAK